MGEEKKTKKSLLEMASKIEKTEKKEPEKKAATKTKKTAAVKIELGKKPDTVGKVEITKAASKAKPKAVAEYNEDSRHHTTPHWR